MAEPAQPKEEVIPSSIGPYKIRRLIAKGGMGEVLLAHDPICEREVALKRIRPDLQTHEILKNRFLREASITSQLTHPGVVAIYTIHKESNQLYYTMPYIEGETFRQLLRHQPKPSIASLMPIYRSICETVAYTHSKDIIHRDLKPENILVGRFGEVVILDWGLAQHISEKEESEEKLSIQETNPELTHPGKIVGTLAYMAPERALGAPATIQTDIYALGVILYQILTLHLPFSRTTVKDFKKSHVFEKLLDPEEVAPYREVPPRLSRIVKKCLETSPKQRYSSMEELLHDLTGFLEGRSEWFETARLDILRKKDWEFQENVLISKHIAITRSTEEAEWVSIMLSRASFSENTRLETEVYIGSDCSGIGFLLCVPEAAERSNPLEGYCLWLGSEAQSFSQLFRNTVEVMRLPELFLKKNQWHLIEIEKTDNNIHFALNGVRVLTYLSYLPLVGTHVGVVSRDADFQMKELIVSVGSQNLTVSCLSIPDAFLANKDYKKALAEYRRIGYSFPGHAEGREALFRAGITLLEQAKNVKGPKKAERFYAQSLEEFAKLHRSPGAPLEYLGKSLVYQELKDHTEEIKCFELALRRYQKHPLIDAIKEQILYRMHESSQKDRRSAYQLILLVLRHLPDMIRNIDSKRLFKYVMTHWEVLPFLENPLNESQLGSSDPLETKLKGIYFSIPLAFWLAEPYTFFEIFEDLKETPDPTAIGNLLFTLFELGSEKLAESWLGFFEKASKDFPLEQQQETEHVLSTLKPLIICHSQDIEEAISRFFHLSIKDLGTRELRTLLYLMDFALQHDLEEKVHVMAAKVQNYPLSIEDKIQIDALRIWAFLQEENWQAAGRIFETYPYELLNQESTLLHPLYGCWLYVTEGEEIARIHFAGVIDTPFPRSWALLGHEITNKISENPTWLQTSFMWERRRLYRQLTLYYQCAENPQLESHYRQLERQEYLHVAE